MVPCLPWQRLLTLQRKPPGGLRAVGTVESCSQKCHGTVSKGEVGWEACSERAELHRLVQKLPESSLPPHARSQVTHLFLGSNGQRQLLLVKASLHGNTSNSPLGEKKSQKTFCTFLIGLRLWVGLGKLPSGREGAPGGVSQRHSVEIHSSLKHHLERLKSL